MARAVIRATASRAPASAASSSMTSCSISVESTSVTTRPGPPSAKNWGSPGPVAVGLTW